MTYTDVQGSQDEQAEHSPRQSSSNICYVRINIPVFRVVGRDDTVVNMQQKCSRPFMKCIYRKHLSLFDIKFLNKKVSHISAGFKKV